VTPTGNAARRAEAQSLYREALDAARAHDFRSAEEGLARAAAIFLDVGAQRNVARCSFFLGLVWVDTQRYAEAEAALDAARVAFEHLSEPSEVARCWNKLGRVYTETGRYDAAVAVYQHAREFHLGVLEPEMVAECALRIGHAHAAAGRDREAEAALTEARDVFGALGSGDGVATCTRMLACLRGDPTEPLEEVPLRERSEGDAELDATRPGRFGPELLERAGLGGLAKADAKSLLAQLYNELEDRVGQALVERLGADEVAEFAELMDAADNEAASVWLGVHVPHYPQIVHHELVRLEVGLSLQAPRIRKALGLPYSAQADCTGDEVSTGEEQYRQTGHVTGPSPGTGARREGDPT